MDQNLADLIRQSSDYKKKREEKYRADSKDRLGKIIKKKIETTMIGAISSIEEHFGFLWAQEDNPNSQIMKDLFQKVRSEILDKGNTQSRNIDVELSNYEMEWKRYSMTLPVKPVTNKDN
jgi:hypothetical protein